MPLSWNEIRARAIAFSNEWSGESSESAEAKTFWDEFFKVFGVPRRRIATFEQRVERAGQNAGYKVEAERVGFLFERYTDIIRQ